AHATSSDRRHRRRSRNASSKPTLSPASRVRPRPLARLRRRRRIPCVARSSATPGEPCQGRRSPCASPRMAYLELHLPQHSVDRFRERVGPSLTIAAAEEELSRLVPAADVVPEPPTWHAERQRRTAAAYLVVGDMVLPAEPVIGEPNVLVAVTCIAR